MQIEKTQKGVKAIKPKVLATSNGEGSGQKKLFDLIFSSSEGTTSEANFLDDSLMTKPKIITNTILHSSGFKPIDVKYLRTNLLNQEDTLCLG